MDARDRPEARGAAAPTGEGSAMRLAMVACCVAMLAPAALILASDRALGANLSLLAPLALCLGAHLLMHRFTGRSCQGARRSSPRPEAVQTPRPEEAGAPLPEDHLISRGR